MILAVGMKYLTLLENVIVPISCSLSLNYRLAVRTFYSVWDHFLWISVSSYPLIHLLMPSVSALRRFTLLDFDVFKLQSTSKFRYH